VLAVRCAVHCEQHSCVMNSYLRLSHNRITRL